MPARPLARLAARIARRPCRFLREERAALSIEAVIMLPLMCLMYVGGYQYFDSYRREAQIYKSTYAVADLVSRRAEVGPGDLEGLADLFGVMTFSEEASYMRFTEVLRGDDGLEIVWSYGTDDQPGLTASRMQRFQRAVPRLDPNERAILVESYVYDRPRFVVGLEPRIIANFFPVSARYESCVVFRPDPVAPAPGCLVNGGAGDSVASGTENEPQSGAGGID